MCKTKHLFTISISEFLTGLCVSDYVLKTIIYIVLSTIIINIFAESQWCHSTNCPVFRTCLAFSPSSTQTFHPKLWSFVYKTQLLLVCSYCVQIFNGLNGLNPWISTSSCRHYVLIIKLTLLPVSSTLFVCIYLL